MTKLILILTLVFLTACSTYTKEQCLDFDWKKEGHKSAMEGKYLQGSYNHYLASCKQEHDVTPKAQEFENGYNLGLKKFCTSKEGLRFGSEGGSYGGTCPEESESNFLNSYNVGSNNFLKSEFKKLKEENERLHGEVSKLQGEISSLRLQLDSAQ